MNNIKKINKDCTGCRACEQICQKKAIEMRENLEGFLYPYINQEKCINCGICLKKCHIYNEIQNKNQKEYLAVKPIDKSISKNSTSGGIAHLVSQYIIKERGYVFGATMDSNFNIKQESVNSIEDLNKFRGSKYVISDTKYTFSEVKSKLQDNKSVLYIGTACQIAGLKNFLEKEYDNLYTIDFVCHGVPSNKLFKKYISYLEKKYKSKIKKYEFRNKDKTHWGMGYVAKVGLCCENTLCEKEKYLRADFDPYYSNFLKGNTYRESCYRCKYADPSMRLADLTIGDFWGIEKFRPEFYDKNGVSLCIINSKKGKFLINKLKQNIEIENMTYEEAVYFNGNLIKATERPKLRDSIYDEIDKPNYINKKLKININIYTILKMIAPKKIFMFYKKYIKK